MGRRWAEGQCSLHGTDQMKRSWKIKIFGLARESMYLISIGIDCIVWDVGSSVNDFQLIIIWLSVHCTPFRLI